jgi:hypothetical protein
VGELTKELRGAKGALNWFSKNSHRTKFTRGVLDFRSGANYLLASYEHLAKGFDCLSRADVRAARAEHTEAMRALHR